MDPRKPEFAKCECVHCSGHLEFERSYAGMSIQCPHCGQDTLLSLPRPVVPHAPAPVVPVLPPSGPDHLHAPVSRLPHYLEGGGEVHLGDRVRYKDIFAKVVFLDDGQHSKYAAGFSEFVGSDLAIVLCDDDGQIYSLKGEEERLTLVHR